jgi:hypothetical protein
MSLSLAIAGIGLADLALLGLLAFVMSRAALLAPHLARDEVRAARAAPAHSPYVAHAPGRPARSTPATATSRS